MKNRDERTPSGTAISELIVAIFRLNGRLLVAGDRLVEDLGLTSARWQVLGAIALSSSPEPVSRLARNMGLNRQGVQRIVGELVAEGFVELKDNPHHRNAKLVLMTAKGLRAYDAALQRQAPWVNMLGEGFNPKNIRETGRILDALRQRLEQTASDTAQRST
jgi:DNA-binding MarR family transcriptional regulator